MSRDNKTELLSLRQFALLLCFMVHQPRSLRSDSCSLFWYETCERIERKQETRLKVCLFILNTCQTNCCCQIRPGIYLHRPLICVRLYSGNKGHVFLFYIHSRWIILGLFSEIHGMWKTEGKVLLIVQFNHCIFEVTECGRSHKHIESCSIMISITP